MASAKETSSRANIRIEIKNDFTEEMDVEDTEENLVTSDADIEDGEISDSRSNEDTEIRKQPTNRDTASGRVDNKWQNSEGSFSIKEDEGRLQSRAARFGLNPSDLKNMTELQLQELHSSLGIGEKDEINTRFEAIHMYGTKDLTTQDVFAYFGKYGPASIEWISDESCNVVWLDKISAARAFHGISREIEGLPLSGNCDPFGEERKDEEMDDKEGNEKVRGRSILLKEREVVLSDNGKEMSSNKINISEINIPIPPGYWRLGESHLKAEYILMRFAKRTDKKPLKAEKFPESHRKYGNPNFGGMKGLISESKKKRLKGLLPEEKVPSGNPWGSLAKNWNNEPQERPITDEPPVLKKVSKSILNRLGSNKRSAKEEEDDEEEEEEEPEKKKSKVPRMRMYADEEEARIEKVKQLKKIRELEKIEEKMAKTIPDLRNRIGRHAIPKQPIKMQQTVQIPEPAKIRPIRIEVRRHEEKQRHLERERQKETRREREVSSESDEESNQSKQRSKVTLIVKKPILSKPTVASTIWSRLDLEKRKQTKEVKVKSDSESKSDSSNSESSDSDSDSDEPEFNSAVRDKFSKAVNSRPGFNRDLKSRLGLNTDHKSPLRIEINNDHYKK